LFVQGWALQQLWLFIVAPLVGAAIAALAYGAIRIPDNDPSVARMQAADADARDFVAKIDLSRDLLSTIGRVVG
jgi:aquaporin Z